VPLPSSAWMLLSGITGVTTFVCKRRRTRAHADSSSARSR
jgi:hypothetical protein